MGCCGATEGVASAPGRIGVGLTVIGFIESDCPCVTTGVTHVEVGGLGRAVVPNA